jgi:MFS family permease
VLVGVGVLVWSLASGASGLAGTYAALLITRLFVGVGEAGYGPAAPTIISDLYPVQRRGAVLSWFYMAIPVGAALGYGLGAGMLKLAAHLGHPDQGWRWAFYAVVPPGLLLGLFCFFRKEPARGQCDQPESADGAPAQPCAPRKARLADYTTLLTTPSYVLDTAGMAAMTFAIGGIAYWMPAYLKDRGAMGGDSDSATIVFSALSAVAGITATLLGGIAGDKLRSRFSGSYFLVSGAGILLAVVFILLMLWSPFPLAWVWVFLALFFLFFNTGPSNSILANVTHPSVRATAFALNILLIHVLGDVPSPPLLGFLNDRYHSWNPAFYVVCATTAFGGLLWLWGARYLGRDTERAPYRLAAAPAFPLQ